MHYKARARTRGFTLIEILIVVVILGILAAIVIPQFTDASQSAELSSVRSQLQTVRSQVELYRVRHAGDISGLGATDTTLFSELTAPADTDEDPYLQATPQLPNNWSWNWDDSTGRLEVSYAGNAVFDLPGGWTGTQDEWIESW